MALFGKPTLEKLLKEIEKLSDDEKEELKKSLDEVGTEATEEPVETEAEAKEVVETEVEAPEETENSEEAETEVEEVETEDEPKENLEEDVEPQEEIEEETEATEEEVSETDIAEAKDEVAEAEKAKLEALYEDFANYKAKVDALYEKLDLVEKPVESVGLGKQREVELGKEDDELSAFEYAQKYAKY